MRETMTINNMTYEKCDPIESEILDLQFDQDEYGWGEKKQFISPVDASMNRIEELINQILAPLLPDSMEITMTPDRLFIADYEHGVERTYILSKYVPTNVAHSMTTAKKVFDQLTTEADRKRIEEKTIVRRGEWWKMPNAKYNRYGMIFRNGGTVPCGLEDGTDNIPALEFLIGRGEYVWSRPAIAALDKDFDLEKGTEILDLIHERLRLKAGRSEAYRRTYGG